MVKLLSRFIFFNKLDRIVKSSHILLATLALCLHPTMKASKQATSTNGVEPIDQCAAIG
jgi:hypothetical protein